MPCLPLAAACGPRRAPIGLEIVDEWQQEARAIAAPRALVVAPQLARQPRRVHGPLLDQVAEQMLHDRDQRERVAPAGALIEPVAEAGKGAVGTRAGVPPQQRERVAEVAAVRQQVPVTGE